MSKAKDITGQRFGKLVAIERSGRDKDNGALWKCKCDCGNTIVTRAASLRNGNTKSCGCLYRTALIGQRFGRLTVTRFSHKAETGGLVWECVCDCGNITLAPTDRLRSGGKKSCGCLYKIVPQSRRNAGVKKHPLYKLYNSIKARCYCKTDIHYSNYGERGIKMADEWFHDFWAFENYMMGLPHYGEKGYSIDRIDVNGDYAPGNVRWANGVEQARNRRSNNLITAFGQTKTIADWADEYGINYYTLWSRIYKSHMSAEIALTTPIDTKKRSANKTNKTVESTRRNTCLSTETLQEK